MSTTSCFYCQKDQRLHDLMIPLKEFQWSNLYLFKDQKHPGRVVLALKEHKTEIWQLSDEQRDGYFKEVSLVSQAISTFFAANKINYAIYGDLVSHFHIHIVPKKKDELQWGDPFTDTLPKVLLSEAEYKILADRILNAL